MIEPISILSLFSSSSAGRLRFSVEVMEMKGNEEIYQPIIKNRGRQRETTKLMGKEDLLSIVARERESESYAVFSLAF